MAAGQGRRSILTGPGAVSSHAAKGQPPALPVTLLCLAHRGPAAAVRAWLDRTVTRAVGRTLWRVRCTVHLLSRSAASATTGAGHDLRWRPEMHDPALAADRTWSPRQETARLAAFRPLAFPAGPLARYPAAGAAPPGAWPAARPDRPSVRRGSAGSTRDGCRGGTAASSRPAPVGQARTARHQPSACEGITRRTAGRAWLPDLPRRTISSPLAGSSAQCAGQSLGSPP
jgi:hypothetical protein